MFGFITKRAHNAAAKVWAEEIKTLTTARDALAIQVDEHNRLIIPLESDLHAKNNRITNMQKDIDRLEAERDQYAAEVERMRPIVEKAERRRAQAMKNLQQNKSRTLA
ncbi:hypothetical protein [Blastomonas sp. CCH2-A2]|uniref:hypothetical protein n=1 Tax=Blastomonas sp. CCH2-A2 TaxID=1768788 RepID=UPI0008248FA0|nr:hypothetical protein [Blastomonas sp. CCH2-A2]